MRRNSGSRWVRGPWASCPPVRRTTELTRTELEQSCLVLMLRYVNEREMEEAEKKEEETAEELQYQDYIERSIEMLANTGLNPLLL